MLLCFSILIGIVYIFSWKIMGHNVGRLDPVRLGTQYHPLQVGSNYISPSPQPVSNWLIRYAIILILKKSVHFCLSIVFFFRESLSIVFETISIWESAEPNHLYCIHARFLMGSSVLLFMFIQFLGWVIAVFTKGSSGSILVGGWFKQNCRNMS